MAYNKYKNVKVHIDGYKFDSKAEAERYLELKILSKAGMISNLALQPKFEIQPHFRHNSKTELAINYIADFSYTEKGSDKIIVEDVKGMETDVFKIKRKMFIKIYGDKFELRIIR